MAINLTNVLNQIETRHAAIDSNTDAAEHTRLDAINDRINSMGGILTYRSTGHLPEMVDSGYVGTIAYVAADNVFGDSSGAFYMGTFRDSNWVRIATKQDSDEAAIPEPGSGPSVDFSPWPEGVLQGGTYGYAVFGYGPPAVLSRHSFTSDGNATTVQPSFSPGVGGGTQSDTKIYGFQGTSKVMHTVPFASDTSTKTTTPAPDRGASYNQQRGGVGFSSSKYYQMAVGPTTTLSTYVQSGPFAADTASTAPASLAYTTYGYATVTTSGTDVYMSGMAEGATPNLNWNAIQKMPTSSEDTISDVGDMVSARAGHGNGAMSSTHGYHIGRGYPTPYSNQIDKYPFAADGDATDVGDLTIPAGYMTASSSTTHGYRYGGNTTTPGPTTGKVIEKWSFSSDGNATDVGDLSNSSPSAPNSQVAGSAFT